MSYKMHDPDIGIRQPATPLATLPALDISIDLTPQIEKGRLAQLHTCIKRDTRMLPKDFEQRRTYRS
jgi:hypothetical protein